MLKQGRVHLLTPPHVASCNAEAPTSHLAARSAAGLPSCPQALLHAGRRADMDAGHAQGAGAHPSAQPSMPLLRLLTGELVILSRTGPKSTFA